MTRTSLPAALGALLLAAVLAGCETPEQMVGPNWAGPRSTPSGREFTPDAANRQNVAGWVMLLCRLGEGQTAQGCRVIAETPTGWGFGDAALRTREGLRITNASSFPGQHVPAIGEVFQIPIIFCPPDDTGCAARFHQAVIDFNAQASAARRQARAGDCAGAVKAAAALAQPAFTAFIAEVCRSAR